MQQSDVLLLIISLAGLILIFGGLYYFLGDDSEKVSREKKAEPDQKKAGPRRKRIGVVNNPEIPAPADGDGEGVEHADGGNVDDEDGGEDQSGDEDNTPLTRKEFLKMEKKRLKQEEKAQDEAQRSAKKDKQAKRDAIQQQKDLDRESEEIKRQEEEELLKKNREEKEKEEYDKWKDMFSVEEAGSEDVEGKAKQDLLEEFISFIKRRKVVVLEDLAIEFGLPAAQCVSRVQSLEEMGQLSGVVDDRGKFIYVSPEELQAVARFVQRRGRVSIADLAIESNKLINLKEVVEAVVEEEPDTDTAAADTMDTDAPQA